MTGAGRSAARVAAALLTLATLLAPLPPGAASAQDGMDQPGAAAPSHAPHLDWPIDCTLGKSCYIEDYVDADPGPDQRDYTCGLKSRDGHRGTDIMLTGLDAMREGVAVRAAAPGRVAAIRNDVPDRPVTPQTRDSIRGRECGNAVRIDHGHGWSTLYCHMARGSVTVRAGQRVAAGAVLGRVGLSGLTNAPHLHLGVLHERQIVDPFAPGAAPGTCGDTTETLWHDPPPYTPAGLFTAGFSTAVPDFDAVQSGAARVRHSTSDLPLVVYGYAFLAQPGDVLTLSATGPRGDEIFRRAIPLPAPKKRLFRALGRKPPPEGWPPGLYRGTARLSRGARLIAVRHADIRITAR